MFDINTSRDFLGIVEANFADFEKEPGSSRLAINCALTAYHLHEWVWNDWLKNDDETRKLLRIDKEKDAFLRWIDCHCVWFQRIQELANGAKHVRKMPFDAKRVSLLPEARGLPNAGAEGSHWDGPMPFITGDTEVLLIDCGPADPEFQYLLVGQLLYVVLQFWRGFIERFAP